MAEIKISPMLKSDTDELAKIDRVIFGGTFKAEDFSNYLNSDIYYFNVAKIDEKAVGYIGYMIIAGEADIINIGVLPNFRGQSIGKMLLSSMLQMCKQNGATCVHLEVRKSNTVAIKLYESYGFLTVGVSKNHYKQPTEDALRMNLCIKYNGEANS